MVSPRSFSTGSMTLPGVSTVAPVASVSDPLTQMNTYRSYVTMLADPGAKDEIKLKAAQELSENFELIVGSSQYPAFLEHAMKIFLKILSEGEPHFISEYNIQQVRKLILEMIHRLPTSDALRPHVKNLLTLMFKLLETENEDNVLVGLRIIIELHKQYRPQFSPEIQHFLHFVKAIYRDLPNHLHKIFEPRAAIRVKDLTEVDINALLAETYTITAILSEKKTADGTQISYSLIPRAVYSLKVLQELPIIVVLMYQLYKQSVHQDVEEFIPLIMSTVTLQPAPQHRDSPSFNKEVFVDFMGAQIKTLSFLAYVIRMYQETVAQHSNMMVQGVIGLLTLCPPEVAHQRKELLVAARHILSTELRTKFVPVLEQLFDENVLLGGGWTVHETLRPLAYSTLADLVHHVRHMLPLKHLASAVHLFSKNVHDESLPTNIQTMSCKLLLNLVDLIRQRSEAEHGQGRQLLMRMLEVFVLKFKTIVKLQLPVLISKWKTQETPSKAAAAATTTTTTTTASATANNKDDAKPLLEPQNPKEEKSKFGFPASQAVNYSVADCRSLVKTLVCGAKTITWGCASCKTGTDGATKFQPKETLVFIKLVKWALQALDIYTLSPNAQTVGMTQQARSTAMQTVRTKEEKEVLEHFAGVFTMMDPQTFQEVFSTSIDYMVNRIARNSALQIIGNTFLSNPSTSPIFATVLVEYLLERMEEMGHNVEKSNLYLRLFKLVFGCVSLFPAENEQMLRPHLHQIVNRAMELALSAREPYNYFLLLRALFRSIGGGSHDLLYQEFLPLLPNLLQGLNSLQSSLHKQHMKDLFVELCLTVPVRLSSLLPYLPMLMDPLVSALNGSHTLISQGLRTLELCVDNLQPDFLYEHIQPVRADLMQALWRTLRNPTDQVAHVAFRVLGKFGGGNRKMMIEPQRLEYNESETPGPAIITLFQDYKASIAFPVEKVIETAFVALKTNTTDAFYKRQAWEVIRCYLVASMNTDVDDKLTLSKLLSHPSFVDGKITLPPNTIVNKSPDKQGRATLQTALTGMFVAVAIKDLRSDVIHNLVTVVQHFTLVAITQQAGPFPLGSVRTGKQQPQGMDPFVLIDALTVIMGHEEKELIKPGSLALHIIVETATTVLGSKERACKLPLMQYLAECMCNLCYDRAWFAKVGGCIGIKNLLERMSMKWIYEHLFLFVRALLFVMMDLTGEVSSGAVDIAKTLLEKMLVTCVSPPTTTDMDEASIKELLSAQQKSVNEVTHELVRQVTSPNTLVRQQAMHLLELLAGIQNKSVTAVMEPFKEVLADIIPPRRHLLRHQPANAQIGLMDGNTFCTTLTPRLFTIDLNIEEHKVFLNDVTQMCELDDASLLKNPCYKSMTNLVTLRKSALKALAACHYIPTYRERIFNVLYRALERPNPELQETAFECMKQFIAGFDIDIDMVHAVMRPLLLTLGDYRNLCLNGIKRLSYLTRLFPTSFNEKLCDQLLQHLRKLLEAAITNKVANTTTGIPRAGVETELDKMAAIVAMFHQIPAATTRCLEVLCRLVFQTEKSLLIEASSPFREPLMKFLLRYPADTVSVFLQDNNIKEPQWTRYLEYLIKHKDGKPFRDILQGSSVRLCAMAKGLSVNGIALTGTDRAEVVHQSIRLSFLLSRLDDQWLAGQATLAATLQELWCSTEYQEFHARVDSVDFPHWQQPRLITKVLLRYFCHHPNEIDLLFHLLRALCGRFIPDFQFLRDFLENTVAQTYSVEWKRSAFFRFVEIFPQPEITQELKARILQYILIPCFSYSFDNGQSESIIGSPPAPEQDSPDNIVSLFISRMIDPDNPFGSSDCVRILLLQFSCLLVEQASPHIHDVANKRQGNKLRRLMTFAWPCLLVKNCVDPATRYHGHLLLSHIIAKFAIHKRIVLQVFHSLLKAHAMEARAVVRQALEILTPAMPVRMEDGNTMLTHWTKKIIVEEGHSMPQLYHILQLVVRHFKVYYPVRHHLVQYMITSIQRLGFSPASSMEQRKLAVELAEVVVKWELQRIRDETAADEASTSNVLPGHKRPAPDDTSESRKRHTSGSLPIVPKLLEGSHKPIEKNHADAVLNLLLRLSCQVNDTPGQAGSAAAATATTGQASQGELLSRRCVALFKTALKPDMWPHCDLKLIWFDKLLVAANATPQPNFANICTALELLTYLLNGVLGREQVLATFKPLQRGLAACMTCANFKVIRLVHSLLSRLMTMFPTEPLTSNVASQYEELNGLYATVSRVIHEGLEAFDKNSTAPTSSLFGTLMLLKAACVSNTCYIDRLISLFMRVLQRIMREHLTPAAGGGAAAAAAAAAASGAGGSGESSPVASELLIVSLDLVKGRVGVMGVDMRKSFIGTILVGLIEKTPDVKVMRAITKMMEDWMKSKNPLLVNQMPSLREKSILLVKLMQYVEKRFPDDAELNAHFLEIVNFIYRDEGLKTTELATKLEPAFMSGLRCSQPHIRAKFFEVFDGSVRRKLFDRLLYIVSSQNWEAMGAHYWIKQCIELLLVTAVTSTPIQASTPSLVLPGVCSVLHTAEPADRANFVVFTAIKDEPGLDAESTQGDEELELELTSEGGESRPPRESRQITDRRTALQLLVARQAKFLQSASEVRTCHFLQAAAQLCHMDTTLAEKTWLELLPRLWHILSDRHQTGLVGEMVPFLCSGAHVVQKDCQPSALNTFVEALSHCDPPVPIKPCLMKYLGKSHNLWHRMALSLERLAFDPAGNKLTEEKPGDCYEFEPIAASPQQETLDSLSDMYWLLCEEDLWAGLWQRHALFPETNTAIAWEQQGFFEQAQTAYEAAMNRMRTEYAANTLQSLPSLQGELVLWEKHWIRCAKELNQWEQLLEYGNSKSASNPQLVLESAWRVPDWDLMKESLQLVELSCPKEMQWRLHLYRGFLAVCKTEEQHLGLVERHVEAASALCMREWRRLPRVVSHIHLPLLQAAQQIMELQEAAQIHQGLLHGRASSLHDMKAIVKTWRNRLPVMADELSHWSDVFTWRQHHYQFISSHYDQQGESGTPNHGMLGVHASAQAIIHFGKVARKHGLTNVCLDSLSRIYTIPSVPIVDCFQKIRQQVKCYVQLAGRAGTVGGRQELQEGLEVIESTNLKYFSKDMTAEFYALKGMLLAKIGRSDDANKAFSAAVQLHDTLVKAWALWGDYLEAIFTQQPLSQPNGEPVADRNMALGVAAITCFMHACRHQNESKSRKYLAKVLWLFSYDDSQGVLADAIDKYSVGVPWLQWLPWIPQLLTCLVHHEGKMVLNLLSGVGRMFPQAVYFPIRTLYLTLKIEQRERYKSAEQQAAATRPQQADGLPAGSVTTDQATAGSTNSARNQPETATTLPIRATPPMWRCSRIMHMQREIHPTVLSSLEGIVDQMVWFRESWYEEVVRQLRQGLAKCYTLAFESRGDVDGATITPHTLNFVRKLSSTFGIGIENMSSTGTSSSGGGTFSSAGSESLVKRAQQTVQDPVFHRMKGQFKSDFDISAPEAMKLHNLISKLKKWIKILESKSKILPKTFLVEEKCRFLSNFSLQTAEVELPGELLLPKHSHYYVRIARFMPRVEVVHKHNTAARRMYIRGHNGKTYPYLVVNDSGLGEARREERVLQLLRLLNHFLGKQKETSRRFLHLTVPRVVAVSPQMRLVEDNPASVSLMSVFKQRLARKGLDPEGPVARYYERLRGVQAQGQQAGHAALMALLQEVQATMVPTEIIREWALHTFPAATDYWTFRKMFTLQLALAGLVEYVLHLTRLNPDMMYIHQDSGLLNVAYFKFDVDDATGNLDANRPVPFRLTPALAEFVTAMGIHGPLTASMVAAARCLAQPSFKVHTILRAILRDEMIAWHKKKYEDQQTAEGAQTLPTLEGENLINMVTRAVTTISQRLNSLAMVETGAPTSAAEASPGRSSDSTSEQPLNEKVSTLVAAASNAGNLCRMDPAWHPWL